MPIEQPALPGLKQITLSTATVTASGCTSANLAIDDDPATSASFGPAEAQLLPLPSTVAASVPGSIYSGGFEVVAGGAPLSPRYLRLQLSAPRFISAVRLRLSDTQAGAAQSNLRIAFVTAGNTFDLLTGGLFSGSAAGLLTGGLAGASSAEVPMAYAPLWTDGDTHLVQLDPPVLATGIVLYPDVGRDASAMSGWASGDFPTVNVSQLQVFEPLAGSGGTPTMPVNKPQVKRARVGCQKMRLFPWAGAAGPYDDNTAEDFAGLKELGFAISSKNAVVTGGETVHKIGGFETERETKVKISVAKCTLRAAQLLLGGSLAVAPKNAQAGEVVVWKQDLSGRAPYFRLEGYSTNGDGSDKMIYPKCKVDGNVSYNLTMSEVTNFEADLTLYMDDTYISQDGSIGAVSEMIFAEDGILTLHS